MAEQNELQLVNGNFSAENLSSGTYTITLEEDGVLNISGFEDSFGTITMCVPAGKASVRGDTQEDGNLSLTEIALSAGTYELEVYAQGGAMNDVEISFTAKELPTPDQYEYNCDLGTISDSETITANIDTSLDRDAYCFTTGKAGYVTVTINANAKEYGFEAYLFDSEEGYVTEGYSEYYNGKGNNSVTFYSEAGVEHWIENLHGYASPEGGNLAPMGKYTLTINVSDSCPPDYKEGTNGNDKLANAAVITIEAYGDNNEYFDEYVSGVNFHTTDDVDYYKFTLDSYAEICIDTWSEFLEPDTEMGLFDSDGKLITHSDNGAGYEYIETNLAAGDYYVMVSGKGEIITDYTLNVYGTYISGDTPYLPGWFKDAITIEFDPRAYAYSNELYAEGYLEDTVGYYKFTLDKESFISTSGWGNIDTIIFDAKGNELKLNQNGYYDLAKGTYYVAAEGDEGWFGFIGLNKVDRYENNNSTANAAEIKFENEYTDFYFEKAATIYSAGDVDYYKFTLKDTANILIDVSSFFDEDADTALYLLNSKGEEISYNDDYVNEYGDRWLFSLIEAENLAAGDYYIKVTGKDAVIPGYRLYIKGEYTAPAVEPVVGVSPDLYTDTEGYITSEVTITVGEQSFANPVWVEDCEGISIYAPRETFSYQEKSLLEGAPETGVTGTVDVQTEEKSVLMQAVADDRIDLFIATAQGTWESGYVARHAGSVEGGWKGTGETVQIAGKNKYTDFFWGAGDDSNLILSDSSNGDAFFADDIYSANPGSICDGQSRFHRIDTIFAGAGDDVIDLTSDDMNVISGRCTVYGGDGNDVIWANTQSALFGDAGNDSIVGSWDGDWIIGGTGNDTMHGGGGYDVFFFADGAGVDTIYQLEGGEVELVFAEGTDVEQNGNVFTYGDGCKVTVTGIDADSIYLEYSNSGMGGDISTTIFKKEDTPVEINLA